MAILAPNTNSTLAADNANKTSTGISPNIIIYVGSTPVGAVQSLSVNQSRTVKTIPEVGTAGWIDSVPQGNTEISGNCTRIRFDNLRISQAFSRGFVNVSAQMYPFDIVIIDRQKYNVSDHIVDIIKNVWIEKIDVNYQADNWILSETMNWRAETIYSILGNAASTSGNYLQPNSVSQGGRMGENQIPYGAFYAGSTVDKLYNIEQAVDAGLNGRRGSLDAGGLIDLASINNSLY